jgi:hypothetical protein
MIKKIFLEMHNLSSENYGIIGKIEYEKKEVENLNSLFYSF